MAYGETPWSEPSDSPEASVRSNPFGYEPWRNKKTFEVSTKGRLLYCRQLTLNLGNVRYS